MAFNYMLAQASGSSSGQSPLDFLQYGVLGLVIVAILFGWLWAKPSVDQLKADKDNTEVQRDALIDAYETQIIPVLAEVQQKFIPAVMGMTESVKELKVEVTHLREEISSLRKEATDAGRNPIGS